jgi:hypothetical protein
LSELRNPHRPIGFAELLLALSIVTLAQTSAVRAGEFRRLAAAQIQLIVGKRITDDTHWSQTVAPGGKLLVRDMDRTSVGSWQIRNDRLCIVRPGILQDCYEVWVANDAIRLRSQDAPMPLTVFLRPATTH